MEPNRIVELTARVVAAYVAHNHVQASDMSMLLQIVHATFAGLGSPTEIASATTAEKKTPREIRRSITPEALISFEDGRRYKTLKRHLTTCGLTPETYRMKWGLPVDYPMTAESYSETRSQLARDLGLGRHPDRRLIKPDIDTPEQERTSKIEND